MLSKLASRRVWTARRTSSGAGGTLQRLQKPGEKDCAPSETRLTPPSRRSAASSAVTVSGFASTVTSVAGGNRLEHTLQRTRLGERRRASAEEHRIEPLAEHVAFLLELGLECVDVRSVLVTVADHRDEVAVPTAVRAERQMDVEMANARLGGDLAHGAIR